MSCTYLHLVSVFGLNITYGLVWCIRLTMIIVTSIYCMCLLLVWILMWLHNCALFSNCLITWLYACSVCDMCSCPVLYWFIGYPWSESRVSTAADRSTYYRLAMKVGYRWSNRENADFWAFVIVWAGQREHHGVRRTSADVLWHQRHKGGKAGSHFAFCDGSKMFALLRSLVSPASPKDKSFAQLVDMLKQHFEPKPVIIVQWFHFHRRNQEPGELLTTELCRLAASCKFERYLDDALRDRLLCGLCDERFQRRLLTEPELTLAKAIELAQGMETAARDTL